MAYEYPQYTNQELRVFEKEMNEKYLIKKVLSDGKEYQFYDEEKFQKDNGGLGGLGGVILTEMKPIQYELNQNKLHQLYKLQGRTEFAKKQEAISTETLVEKVSVETTPEAQVNFDPLAF